MCQNVNLLSKVLELQKMLINLTNSITGIPVWPNVQIMNCCQTVKGWLQELGVHNDHTQTDKYCLELQTTLKVGKMRMAKNNSANKRCIQQNTPLFGFIPIYGLQSRIYDRNENHICQNIMDLHREIEERW